MRLNQWQDQIADWLLSEQQPLDEQIAETQRFPGTDRLQVYLNNYRQALASTLQQSFELSHQCVGDDYFRQLAHGYIRDFPPKCSNLHHYGERFPDYLEQCIHERPELANLGYLPELARYDWISNTLYYAADPEVWDPVAFAQLDAQQQQQSRFELSPDCALLASNWPLHELVSFLQDNDPQRHIDIASNANSHHYLVQRSPWHAQLFPIEKCIYLMLKSVEAKEPLFKLATLYPEQVTSLPEWIHNGWIHRCETRPDAQSTGTAEALPVQPRADERPGRCL